jgi:hypothetical protein
MSANTNLSTFNRTINYARYALLTAFLLVGTSSVTADDSRLVPNSDYSPEQVVRIVIEALKINDEANNDNGIATVFEFASPGNRSNTGPLPRFARMIKLGFPDMLNHSDARYDPMEVSGNTAVQAVWLLTPSGDEVGYAFQLGKQQGGDYANMWMTEAVMPLGPGTQGGTRI